jgi:glycosyltransferase involved in cell wall biosynthesis
MSWTWSHGPAPSGAYDAVSTNSTRIGSSGLVTVRRAGAMASEFDRPRAARPERRPAFASPSSGRAGVIDARYDPVVPRTSQPKVSVGIPVYNGESVMSRAIESVLAQTYGDLELIIADNCSTDGTEDLCRSYMEHDDRIVFNRADHNLGLAKNFSRLPREARGECFKWLACDDFIHPDFIAHCLPIAESSDDIITVAPTLNIARPNGEVLYLLSSYVHHGAFSEDRLTQHRQMMDEIAYCERSGGLVFLASTYGFHRRTRLLHTRLMLPFISSDLVLAGELALWGRIVKLDEPLNNFTLSESDASTTANFVTWNPDRIQRILDPERTSKWNVAWSQRARHLEHVRGAARAPFGLNDKLRAMEAATLPFRAGRKEWFRSIVRRGRDDQASGNSVAASSLVREAERR